jgi:A/G-specific adenine glycosylase
VKRPRPALPSPEHAKRFSRRLRAWFKRHGRDLPWRRTRDPYRVLISELMLQQTQVARVVPKYDEFLGTFPTLSHIARATPRRVMEAWSGLGYYARARNLHALAKQVMATDGGEQPAAPGESVDSRLPQDPADLRRHPGIGADTAGAVASFAYERRAALVDTNVARVVRRVFAPAIDTKTTAGLKTAWQIAESILPRTGAATWTHNQAIMELGALICTARVRHCDRCPVASLCATRRAERRR